MPATTLIEGDSVKKYEFYVVSGHGWSLVYTEGVLVWWEMFVGTTYGHCVRQFILNSWAGDCLTRG